MTTTINASTSSGLVVTPDNSGNVLLQYNGVAAPAFAVTLSGNQSISANTTTKVLFNTETFDTNNNFASSTFTPTVAGYYQINAFISWSGAGSTQGNIYLYKNGSPIGQTLTPGSGYGYNNGLSLVVQMNGSTDYLEVYCRNSSAEAVASGAYSGFSGCLLRGA
jgi:hypothetical protein